MIKFSKLEENISLGSGWVDLILTEIFYELSIVKIIFEWPGKSDGFLSVNGWKSVESKLEFECSLISNNDIKIQIPPAISQFLDSGVNYKITLFDVKDIFLGQIVVHWKGIRPHRNLNSKNNIFDPDLNVPVDETKPQKMSSSDYLSDNSLELLHDQSSNSDIVQTDNSQKVEIVTPIEIENKFDEDLFFESKNENENDNKIESQSVKRSANKILCKNCGAYTFDTQKKCFWCSKETS